MQPPAAHWSASKWLKSHPRRLVLIGASVRAAAQSAQRAGFLVTGIDLFGDTDSRAACERFFRLGEESLESQVKQHCTGLPSLVVGGTNDYRIEIARLQSVCPTLQQPAEPIAPANLNPKIAWPRSCWEDPEWLRQVAKQAGAMFPTTRFTSPCAHSRPGHTPRWLRKEIGGSGGLGVRWHVDEPPVSPTLSEEHLHTAEAPAETFTDRSVIYQCWVAGRAIGVTYLMDGERSELVGCCRSLWKRHPLRPFVYGGSVGPIQLPSTLSDTLRRVGDTVVTETKASGLINADFIIDREGRPWLLEINPRWSGSCEVLERAFRAQEATRSLFRDHLDAKFASRPAANNRDNNSLYQSLWIKRIIFARHDLRFHLGDVKPVLSNHVTLHDIPSDGSQIQQGEPVCTIVQKAETPWRCNGTASNTTPHGLNKKNPMQEHRVQVCRLHDALSTHRIDGSSPS